jgi:sterol desaturase/sphingolipid hydroxylase (fatty acid hydroxylase superfamily)
VEAVTIAQNIFEHANIELPSRADRFLRQIVVTPDVHHIHHSEDLADSNRNFGTIFSWWDRLFGTYLPAPAAGYAHMQMGLPDLARRQGLNVLQMLVLPFRKIVSVSNPRDCQLITEECQPNPAEFVQKI